MITNRGRSTKRPKSPSPELDEEEGGSSGGSTGTGGGLVIANRQDSLNNFLDDEEGDGLDDEVEGLKTEEEETMALLIDRRLLHKDFILDKFTLALVYFRKVCKPALTCLVGGDEVLSFWLSGWQGRSSVELRVIDQVL